MVDKVIEILDYLFYKDISNHILSFLINKCRSCNKLYFEENTFPVYDNSYVCMGCSRKIRYNLCKNCKLYYDINEDDCCIICNRGDCYMYRYCPLCKIDQLLFRFDGASNLYYWERFSHRQLPPVSRIQNTIDDIIEDVVDNIMFDME